MNKKVQKVLESLQWSIETAKRDCVQFQELPATIIQEAFPDGNWSAGFGFEFTLPYSFPLIQVVKEFMELQFPEYQMRTERQHVWSESMSAGHFITYSDGSHRFDFGFRSGKVGSTCVLNKIGEELKPVYEVVCSQDAADEF